MTSRGIGPIATGCNLRRARGAFASERPDEQLEVFLAIVVGNLVARRDGPDRAQEHLAFEECAFGVRPAGMIGVTAYIAPRGAVDAPAAVDLEHVAAAVAR